MPRGSGGARRAGQCADEGPRAPAPRVAAPKQALHAREQDTERVQQAPASDREAVATRDAQRVKCSEASGGHLARPRLYGRAPSGERRIGAGPQNDGAPVPMLASLGRHGIEAMMTIEGATEPAVVRADVAQGLRPPRPPGARVMMANLRAHKAAGSREASAQTGAQRRSVPPSSPALSPTARWWAPLKTSVRQAKARPREALEPAIPAALLTVTATAAHGWFASSGDA
jgi:DDE superfamily endonuclease